MALFTIVMDSFPPSYDPKLVEDSIYKMWEESGFFNPDKLPITNYKLHDGKRRAFSIVLPPPNVTGTLHLGHATMLAIEDIMVRFHRMKGDDTLWVPGTDHAAIATQNVVEKKLWKEEKKTRHDLGREKFLKKVDEFVQQSKDTIHRQMRKMGASLDWSREAYTLDAPREQAVRTAFKMMYDDGLIYRGYRIVNWCTRCQSTLSDDEVSYKEEKTKFYYLKYGPVVIGTARPETKFLDKIIVVHPTDERYKNLVGTSFDVEWIDGKVKATVVADETAEMELGSGAMTITPAHSFTDFALAQKYGFEIHQIINEKGMLTDAAGDMAGMPVAEARQKVVERLQAKGLVDRIDEAYVHNLSVCYRCDTPIEPLVSQQWFISVSKEFRIKNKGLQKIVGKKTATLKEVSGAVVRKGAIKIIPERFDKTYFHWMDNLRDWCISRQIWFGHRIPVWYCHGKGLGSRVQGLGCELIVSIDTPKQCPTCGNTKLEQDPDTLDTWFSSGLWTFSTLGWPGDDRHPELVSGSLDSLPAAGRRSGAGMTPSDLKRFHPTSVLETGYDILFFWVARMILMTTYVLGEVPFETVYLHGLVRDEQGRKMSKSLGNAIDPLIVSEKYGTDAVRLALVVGTTPGNDLKLSEKKIEGYRNFVNKLWNVARYVSTQGSGFRVQGSDAGDYTPYPIPYTLVDRWILSRLQRTVESVTEDIENYRYSQAAETLRAFTWDEVADWYVEVSKHQLLTTNYKLPTQQILSNLLENLLRLWHPFTPFVTEEIYSKLSKSSETSKLSSALMIEPWPVADKKLIDKNAEKEFAIVQDVISAIRQLRSNYQVSPAVILPAVVTGKSKLVMKDENHLMIERLAKVTLSAARKKPSTMITAHPQIANIGLFVDIGKEIDLKDQQRRVEKALSELRRHVISLESTLSNQEFIGSAPKDIIEARKEMLKIQQERMRKLEQEQKELGVIG